MTSTLKPLALRAATFVVSRSLFLFSFSDQYSVFDFGFDASLHPGCLCQKQPCTNIAHLRVLFAKSGFPGRLSTWLRNRSPKACTAALVRISGFVSRDLMRAIISERVSGARSRRGRIFGRGVLIRLCRHARRCRRGFEPRHVRQRTTPVEKSAPIRPSGLTRPPASLQSDPTSVGSSSPCTNLRSTTACSGFRPCAVERAAR